jgi:two-component system chemotaxis response regulator CheY
MVVDDFATMRRIVGGTLKKLGYENIVEADNGMTALEMLRANKVDLVLSDCNMPVMSGLELLQAVRADDDLQDIVFILMTGEDQGDTIIEMVKAGVNDYIVKPFTPQALDEKLMRALG